MKRKFTALCSIMVALSICVTIFGATNTDIKNDVTTATMKNYYAPKAETTTSSGLNGVINDVLGGLGGSSSSDTIDSVIGSIEGVSGDIDSAIGGFGDSMDILGGLGDSFGGIGDSLGGIGSSLGDAFGGIFGGLGGSGSTQTTVPATTSANSGLIIPVPAATQTSSEVQTSADGESAVAGETVDYANSSNPYTKPTAEFTAGDADESIKWIQWIFVYTGYGLKDDGITGILDEDTVAVVKKLQHEKQLTVDGNITADVIKAAEALYYQSILGGNVTAVEVSSDATTSVNASTSTTNGEEDNSLTVVLLIVVLVIIWILAIGGIVLLFMFKKKKMNAVKNAEEEKKETEEKEENKSNEIGSLSDLFEEAEKKDK